jgi:hypothetical protein
MRIRKSYYVAIVVWLLIAILFFIMNKRYNWLTGDDSNLFLGIITVAVSIMSLGLATMQKPSYKGKLAVWNVKESARQVNNNMLVPIGTYSCLTFKIDNYKNEPIESLEVSFRIPEKMYYPERGSHLLLYSFKETIYLKSSKHMSNFKFLQQEWPSLYTKIKSAEERTYTEPISTASYCRLVLEESMHLLYDLEHADKPYNTELVNLMNDEAARKVIPSQLMDGLHIVRKIGNNAAHYGNRITSKDSITSIRYIYAYLKWFALNYSKVAPELPGVFNDSFITAVGETQKQVKQQQEEQEKAHQELVAQIQKLQQEKDRILEQAKESEATLEAYKEKEALAKEKLKTQKQARLKPITTEFTEAQTSQHLIDVDLKSAGWYLTSEGRDTEYPVYRDASYS